MALTRTIRRGTGRSGRPEPSGRAGRRRPSRSTAALALALGSLLAGTASASAVSIASAEQALKLGLAYDIGANGPSDPARARVAYTIAAAAGLPEAEFNLGVLYDSGVGTGIDRARAALWYARAASHGFGRAAFNLGELYELGDGVPRDAALAVDWFRVADEGGIPAARTHAAALLRAVPRTDDLAPPRLAPAQVDAAAPGASVPIELVWTEGAMPADGRFFVEIVPVTAGAARDLVWQPVRSSALMVDLPPTPAPYRWRVIVSSDATGHYVSSDWQEFRVGAS